MKHYWGAKLVLILTELISSIAVAAAILVLFAHWANPDPPGLGMFRLWIGVGLLAYGLYGILIAQLGQAIINIAVSTSDIAITAREALEVIQTGQRQSIQELKAEWALSERKI